VLSISVYCLRKKHVLPRGANLKELKAHLLKKLTQFHALKTPPEEEVEYI